MRPENHFQAARLGLHSRRSCRETGWQEQALLFLRAPVFASKNRRCGESLPRAHAARAAGRFLPDARSERSVVQSDSRRLNGPALYGDGHTRLLSIRRRDWPHPSGPVVPTGSEYPENVSGPQCGQSDLQPRDGGAGRHAGHSAAARAHRLSDVVASPPLRQVRRPARHGEAHTRLGPRLQRYVPEVSSSHGSVR